MRTLISTHDPRVPKVSVADLIEDRLVRKLDESGVLDALYAAYGVARARLAATRLADALPARSTRCLHLAHIDENQRSSKCRLLGGRPEVAGVRPKQRE
jgi:hypothetical protein